MVVVLFSVSAQNPAIVDEVVALELHPAAASMTTKMAKLQTRQNF
jgi:hypothetical protein